MRPARKLFEKVSLAPAVRWGISKLQFPKVQVLTELCPYLRWRGGGPFIAPLTKALGQFIPDEPSRQERWLISRSDDLFLNLPLQRFLPTTPRPRTPSSDQKYLNVTQKIHFTRCLQDMKPGSQRQSITTQTLIWISNETRTLLNNKLFLEESKKNTATIPI